MYERRGVFNASGKKGILAVGMELWHQKMEGKHLEIDPWRLGTKNPCAWFLVQC